jgi:16S rRNA (cytosine967-C5)-methyltransferase
MRPGGRLAAAIEVLADIEARHRPASEALKDWGNAHRFAGSGDRAAIGNLVFDALRMRRSLAWRMRNDTPRALALAVFVHVWKNTYDVLVAALEGDPHAPHPLNDGEREALLRGTLDGAPAAVRADVPDWIWPRFEAAFGANAVAQGQALAERAPLDLRVNTLKADRARVLKALSRHRTIAFDLLPDAIRIEAPHGPARAPNVQADAAFAKGWFEVQDAGSQAAALLAGPKPGMQVADICAGAGGKTLALAAAMENKGQIHAYDADRFRLKNIFERLKRAGTRNVQVLEAGDEAALLALAGKFDLVLVDAPCSGSGTWRRKPDSKWRLGEEALKQRQNEQDAVLDLAARVAGPQGRITYITCSLLQCENEERIAAFLARNPGFEPAPFGEMAAFLGRAAGTGQESVNHDFSSKTSVQLTPLSDSTDGFFIANLARVK